MHRALIGGLIAFTVAGAAHGAIVTADFSGRIVSGIDAVGSFGSPMDSLEGREFDLTFVFDTTKGSSFAVPGFVQLVGGSFLGTSSPGRATFRVGSGSVSIDGARGSQWFANQGDRRNPYDEQFVAQNSSYDTAYIAFTRGPTDPVLFGQSDEENPCTMTFCTGRVDWGGGTAVLKPDHLLVSVVGNVNPYFVKIPPLFVSVPEPSTWAMLLLGFFGMGAIMRSGRGAEPS